MKKVADTFFPRLFDSNGLLLVHVGQHERDVRGEQVIHLVAQRRLAEQLRAAHQVADGHVEVGVPGGPVGNPGKRVRHENLLKSKSVC
jgi:hypothetical protein